MRALALLALASIPLLAADAHRTDFPPFVMLIEDWNARAMGTANGLYFEGRWASRLVYRDHANWTLEVVATSGSAQGLGSTFRCENGWYSTYEAVTGQRPPPIFEPGLCNGVGRWIHYGAAWSHGWWARHDGPLSGQVTYEDPGERVVFDLRTGLPVRYEAGVTVSATPLLTTDFILERYGY